MTDPVAPRITKWAFFAGDLLLLVSAGLIYGKSSAPLGIWPGALIALCVAFGATLAIVPFVLEYRLVARLAETDQLASTVQQIRNLEDVAQKITGATARWQSVQEAADRVAGTSKAIVERMSAETKAFTEFLQKANEGEKATLRLEAEKLRRAEGDWLQILVRMLDHVYALHLAGVRSGQTRLITQLDQFQHACRDAARRIGLAPFVAGPAEPFDSQRHQLIEDQAAPPGATIAETVATGYTFQGKLLRPALVRLQEGNGEASGNTAVPAQMDLVEPAQS